MLFKPLEIRPEKGNRQLSVTSEQLDLELLLDYVNDYAIRVFWPTALGSEEKLCGCWASGPGLVSAKGLRVATATSPINDQVIIVFWTHERQNTGVFSQCSDV